MCGTVPSVWGLVLILDKDETADSPQPDTLPSYGMAPKMGRAWFGLIKAHWYER